MVDKISVGDHASYLCAKFQYDPIRDFCSPLPRQQRVVYKLTRLVTFLWFLLFSAIDFYDQYVK